MIKGITPTRTKHAPCTGRGCGGSSAQLCCGTWRHWDTMHTMQRTPAATQVGRRICIWGWGDKQPPRSGGRSPGHSPVTHMHGPPMHCAPPGTAPPTLHPGAASPGRSGGPSPRGDSGGSGSAALGFGGQDRHRGDTDRAPRWSEFSSSRIHGRITMSFIIFKDTQSWRENEFFFITQFPGYFYCAS